ncbi:glycosyltransferase family protein [Desulfogranum japonicum]|uniref:glycosyltransferase family protein n=1 Tax=Desulfogranum japonicum TaxID=231447 RepID=UPI000420DCB1|nr:glycosyltransferase [Desulfogranum japonicum]
MAGLYNILIYSHDTYGLGHIRRTMAIAGHLRSKNVNVLILTGSPIAGRFSFPENVDFVRIPGMIKKTNDEYHSLSIRIDPEHALNIRQSIILTTVQTFQPNLFLVDKEPLGLKKEVLPTLEWIQQHSPQTRTILGLRDIMDDRDTVRTDWQNKDVYRLLDTLYSEIWVYGCQNIYDAVSEYAIPENVRNKVHFTGYLPRQVASVKAIAKARKKFCVKDDEQMLVVTTGGGGDGYAMMDAYMKMFEQGLFDRGKSILVTGPFMPLSLRRKLAKRGRKAHVKVLPFYPRMEELIGAADVVVSMGGYNTMCEVLSQRTPALIIPRETPRREQLLRAMAFKREGLIDYLPWSDLDEHHLAQKLNEMFDALSAYEDVIRAFPLNGIATIKERLACFRAS